jgi:hypothetical protein
VMVVTAAVEERDGQEARQAEEREGEQQVQHIVRSSRGMVARFRVIRCRWHIMDNDMALQG